MATNKADGVAKAAKILRDAYDSGKPCPPVRDILGGGVDAAYAVKNANTEFWLGKGRRLIGRKIGVSSKAAQARFGADHPDFGMLFADMVFGDGQEIAFSSVLQPRVEAEVAFCVGDNLDVAQLTICDMIEAKV